MRMPCGHRQKHAQFSRHWWWGPNCWKMVQIVQFGPELDLWDPKESKLPPDGPKLCDQKSVQSIHFGPGLDPRGPKGSKLPPVGPKCFTFFFSTPNFQACSRSSQRMVEKTIRNMDGREWSDAQKDMKKNNRMHRACQLSFAASSSSAPHTVWIKLF